ncbi:MAG: transferase [Chloroflexi bacterium]|nr:transferase [Chloroflexota bacterium]
MKISEWARILPGVEIGEGTRVEDFVILGQPPHGSDPGTETTVIGKEGIIRSHTVIYAGNRIGDHFQTGHGVMIRERNTIGDRVSIGTGSVVEHHVTIGNRVRIHSQAFIPEYSTLEDDCWIGPNVVLTNALHPLCPKAKACLKGATIRRGAKIGANATILPDVVIGEGALVGAGAVVVEDVPPYTVVVGNPARVVKRVSELDCPYGLIDHPYPTSAPRSSHS